MKTPLYETNSQSNMQVLFEDYVNRAGKRVFMKGLCIQGNVKNANGRIYPKNQIESAVKQLKEQLDRNLTVLGEVNHPADLTINLDRVGHKIVDIWMENADGHGKLEILTTPMGNIVKNLIECEVKLGVSSRGSGNVNEMTGEVSDFEIVTIDIVATPSAPNAYPKPIYESLMNMKGGERMYKLAKESVNDPTVQKYLKEQVIQLIHELKIN